MSAGQVWIDSTFVTEGNAGTKVATFTVRRVGGADPFDVSFATADGTALVADGDYVATSGVLHFDAGVESRTISVIVNGDTKFEMDELFWMRLSGATNGALVLQPETAGLIATDEKTSGAGNVRIGDSSVVEGDSGTKLMTFRVERSGGTSPFSVKYATQGFNGGADFVQKSGLLTFAAGETSKTITVEVTGDTVVERNESFNVVLSDATGGAVFSGPYLSRSATGTILDNDTGGAGVVSLSDRVSVTEGNAGTKVLSFTVTRTRGAGAFSIDYRTISFDAQEGTDFLQKAGTLQFAAGVDTQTISVTVNGDTVPELDESVGVNLLNPTNGAIISRDSSFATIVNDDGVLAGRVWTDDVTVTEGNDGTRVATFTVWRSNGFLPFSVDYQTQDGYGYDRHSRPIGRAVAFEDYIPASGVLQFAAGVMSRTVSVVLKGDTTAEAAESFLLNLSNPTNGAVIWSTGIAIIMDDDGAIPGTAGRVRIDDVSVVEGDNGTRLATFTVTRSEGTGAFSIDYDTADDSASVVGSDYLAASGTLQFAAGVTSQTITVAVKGDTVVEYDQSFAVALTNATNGATIDKSLAYGWILNDDIEGFSGVVSIGDPAVTAYVTPEGNSGTQTMTFTVTRTSGTAAFSVKYATVDGGASAADGDYVAAAGTLNFAEGVNSQTISVLVNGDTKPEPDQSFVVRLSDPTNGALLGSSVVTVRIQNDEPTVLIDTGARLGAMTPAELAALSGQGIRTVNASDDKLALSAAQWTAMLGDPSSFLDDVGLALPDDVTLKDTGANLATLSSSILQGLGLRGFDRIDVTDNVLTLGMGQAVRLSTPLSTKDVLMVRDTGLAIAGWSAFNFSQLAARFDGSFDATDDALFLNVDQYRALGKRTLTKADSVTLQDDDTRIEALTSTELAGLARKGIDRISSTFFSLDLTVAQYNALGAAGVSGSAALADTGDALSGLSVSTLAGLAGKGIDSLHSMDGTLSLNAAQLKALKSVWVWHEDSVTLADRSDRIAALSAAELALLGPAGVDRVDATNDTLSLTLAQYRALGNVQLSPQDSVVIADRSDRIAALTAAEIALLDPAGIDRIDSTSDALFLSVGQFAALGTVVLTTSDSVTLKDTGAALAGLSTASLAALSSRGVDMLDASNNVLALTFSQFSALGAVTIAANDALTVTGTASNEIFTFGKRNLAAKDRIDGDGGTDTLVLDGDYSAGLFMQPATIAGIEQISVKSSHSYSLRLDDGNVAAGQTLAVSATTLGALDSLIFDGSAETNGRFSFTGGAGSSTVTGGKGADSFTGGSGKETVRYTSAAQSSGPAYDTVVGFNAAIDRFDLWTSVAGVDTPITSGSLSSASFDANLATAMIGLVSQHAVLFTANAGNLAGTNFLVIDANGVSGYQSGADLAVRLQQPTNLASLGMSSFV
ncbi:hypothetical protein BH10PSE6_BH10PSE6_30280 [soil metagenome]